MNRLERSIIGGFCCLVMACTAAAPARSEDYPSRPVRLVISYQPGGIVDFSGRVLAQQLSLVLGQPFVVENRPGAGGIVGVDSVAHAAPDGYDLVLLGRQESAPAKVDIDALQQRLDQPAYAAVSASLADAGFHSAEELLGTYAGRARDLQPMLEGASITDDMNLRLQYLAGLGVNSRSSPRIYGDILAHRKFPEDLFTGSGARLDSLREKLGRPHRTF